jgi:hypothetical protein
MIDANVRVAEQMLQSVIGSTFLYAVTHGTLLSARWKFTVAVQTSVYDEAAFKQAPSSVDLGSRRFAVYH